MKLFAIIVLALLAVMIIPTWMILLAFLVALMVKALD